MLAHSMKSLGCVLASLLALAPLASAETSKAGPVAAEHLLRTSTDPLQRESAALALGVGGSHAAVPSLVKRMEEDDNKWVRARCAEALGMLGAIPTVAPLTDALAKEKHPRVRRSIAEALLRLGQRQGLLELMWQLKSGNQHTKAEVTRFLVRTTGQPLGQDSDGWWHYFGHQGSSLLRKRPLGSPALMQIDGAVRLPGGGTDLPLVRAAGVPRWQQLCAVRLTLRPARDLITVDTLRRHEAERGTFPDGCLLLLDAKWPARAAEAQSSPTNKAAGPQSPKRLGDRTAAGIGPGLTEAAARYLLKAAPAMLGVGINAPSLDGAAQPEHPVRDLLHERRLIAVEGLSGLRHLPTDRFRLVIVNRSKAATGAVPALMLALFN